MSGNLGYVIDSPIGPVAEVTQLPSWEFQSVFGVPDPASWDWRLMGKSTSDLHVYRISKGQTTASCVEEVCSGKSPGIESNGVRVIFCGRMLQVLASKGLRLEHYDLFSMASWSEGVTTYAFTEINRRSRFVKLCVDRNLPPFEITLDGGSIGRELARDDLLRESKRGMDAIWNKIGGDTHIYLTCTPRPDGDLIYKPTSDSWKSWKPSSL